MIKYNLRDAYVQNFWSRSDVCSAASWSLNIFIRSIEEKEVQKCDKETYIYLAKLHDDLVSIMEKYKKYISNNSVENKPKNWVQNPGRVISDDEIKDIKEILGQIKSIVDNDEFDKLDQEKKEWEKERENWERGEDI